MHKHNDSGRLAFIRGGRRMKNPERVLDQIQQRRHIQEFVDVCSQVGSELGVEMPVYKDMDTPRLTKKIGTTLLATTNKLDHLTAADQAQIRIIGTMPALIEAVTPYKFDETKRKRDRAGMMSDIQQSKLAIRSFADTMPRMGRGTVKHVLRRAAFLYVTDESVLDKIEDETGDYLWEMMNSLGVEGALSAMDRAPIDNLVVSPGTERIKQVGMDRKGSRVVLDTWALREAAEDSMRKRDRTRVPKNEAAFYTGWKAAHFKPDMPLRPTDAATDSIMGRLEETLDRLAA